MKVEPWPHFASCSLQVVFKTQKNVKVNCFECHGFVTIVKSLCCTVASRYVCVCVCVRSGVVFAPEAQRDLSIIL